MQRFFLILLAVAFLFDPHFFSLLMLSFSFDLSKSCFDSVPSIHSLIPSHPNQALLVASPANAPEVAAASLPSLVECIAAVRALSAELQVPLEHSDATRFLQAADRVVEAMNEAAAAAAAAAAATTDAAAADAAAAPKASARGKA